MTEPHQSSDPARPRIRRHIAIVLLLALTGGLISGTLMWAAPTPPIQAILGGSTTAILLFLEKIIK
jgi:hypothetical protein